MMLLGVEDLHDLPALVLCDGQAFLAVERIDCQRLSGLRTGNQVVVVAVGVTGPDALNNLVVLSFMARQPDSKSAGRWLEPAQGFCMDPAQLRAVYMCPYVRAVFAGHSRQQKRCRRQPR